MKLTHLVGSSDDLEAIDLSRQFISMLRDRSIGFIYGHPRATFLPMHPAVQDEIKLLPELQDEWAEINSLYYHAMAISQGWMTHPYTQLTSSTNITTQAHAQAQAQPNATGNTVAQDVAPATTIVWNLDAEINELIHEGELEARRAEASSHLSESKTDQSAVLRRLT